MMKRRGLFFAILVASGMGPTGVAREASGPTWSDKADGFASLNKLLQHGTTGGAGGKVVTVTTRAELAEYAAKKAPYVIRVKGSIDMSVGSVHPVAVASNKTIIGVGKNAELVKGGLYVGRGSKGIHYPRARNVIIRNLAIHHSPDDGITMDNAHHIWIDHCHFHHNHDGCIDSRFDTTFLTVSWCIFSNHHKTFGIGWTENLTAHITLHHNWFRGTVSRNPSGDNILRAHCYNNYLSGVVSGHHSRGRTNMIVENCLFQNAGNPLMLDDGTLVETGCIFRGTRGRRETRGPAFFDPAKFYKYKLDKTEELPALLSKYAGPQENINPEDNRPAAKLGRLLLGSLHELSSKNELKETPVRISKTKAKVWLARVEQNGRLTFQLMTGTKKATFTFGELTREDHANLAALVAELKPDSKEDQAVAAVYMQLTGAIGHYNEYLSKSSPEHVEKLLSQLGVKR